MNGVRFSREGDRFVLDNGAFQLKGELCEGRLVRNLICGGADLGWLDLALMASSDGKTGDEAGVLSLADARFAVREGVPALDLWGDWWKKTGRWSYDGIAWRVHVRISTERESRKFGLRVIDVFNSGAKPLLVSAIRGLAGGSRIGLSASAQEMVPEGFGTLAPGEIWAPRCPLAFSVTVKEGE